MDETDLRVRNATYGLFARRGEAPAVEDVASEATLRPDEVASAWERLHAAHALVLDPDGTRLLMANPFSAVPTVHRVQAAGRSWFANCAWDAFGVCAALGVPGRIETICPDCDDSVAIEVRDARPDRDDLVFHCLVPAERWWDDIVFT